MKCMLGGFLMISDGVVIRAGVLVHACVSGYSKLRHGDCFGTFYFSLMSGNPILLRKYEKR